MSFKEIFDVVFGILTCVGGIGAIIVLIVIFTSNIIADKLSQKYELKMSKELEKYKVGIEQKTYISKTRFDSEFQLYRDLSKAFFEAVKDITIMIPVGLAHYPADKEKRREYENKLYDNALKSTIEAQDLLNANIPFISEKSYNKYEEILGLCRVQLGVFEDRWNVLYLVSQEEKESFSVEDYRRSREIKDKFKKLNEEIREYLSKLEVIE